MLFQDFSAATKEQWIAQVTKELKGIDIQQVTRWEFEKDNFVEALLFPAETANFEYLQLLNQANEQAGLVGRIWRNQLVIKVNNETQANAKALEALNSGVEALCFQCDEQVNLNTLLQNILLPYCAVSFEVPRAANFWNNYVAYLRSQNYAADSIHGNLYSIAKENFIQNQYPNFRSIVLKTSVALDSPSAQVADLLKQADEQLSLHKITHDVATIVQQIQFTVSLGNLYFVEIAKLRALRLLFAQLAWSYGFTDYDVQSTDILAVTTLQAGKDVNYSLISNTTQAMSGIIAGANTLTITPHQADNQEFAERIARNVSNLLREESYLDKVATPSNGAYFIDQLTDKIAEKAWGIFTQA
jgi:methylmalonyl-CoA mutase